MVPKNKRESENSNTRRTILSRILAFGRWSLYSSWVLIIISFKAFVWNSLLSLNKIVKTSLLGCSREERPQCYWPMSRQDIPHYNRSTHISGMCLQIHRPWGPINPPLGKWGKSGMPLAWPHCSLLAGWNRSCLYHLYQLISKRAHLRLSARESWSHHRLQGKSDLLENTVYLVRD